MNSPSTVSTGRNQLCPCLSGRKHKHCCGGKYQDSGNTATAELPKLLQQARFQAYQHQDFLAAERCFRQVLAIQPNNAEALAAVGQSLYWRHHRAAGREYMRKAAKLLLRQADKSGNHALLELSTQLQIWGEIELALTLAQAAMRLEPKNPAALHSVAACNHRLNRGDQARQILNRLLRLVPEDAGSQILMALLELDNKQYTAAGERLEKLLLSETHPLQLARACLELSRVYDKQKRYDEAFSNMVRAGELERQSPAAMAVDAEFIFNRIRTYRQGFDTDLLRRWAETDFVQDLPVPVFLIGFLRSGTTLAEQVLAAHSQVLTSDENELLTEIIHELERITAIRGDVPAALRQIDLTQVRQLRQLYWQRASAEYTPAVLKKVFVNKVALNSIETGLISCLFPEAKIIFALRDPRDICLSCAMQAFTPSVATINLLSWSGIARQYAAVMDLWLYLRERIAPDYLELRYEDTVGDFENSFRRVFDFLGLEWQDEVIRFHQRLAGRFVATPSFAAVSQPLYQSALARWQGYEKHFAGILPMLQRFINIFGYDKQHPG